MQKRNSASGMGNAIARLLACAVAVAPAVSCARTGLDDRLHPAPVDPALVAACAKYFSCGAPTSKTPLFDVGGPPSTSACLFTNQLFSELLVTGFLKGTPSDCILDANGCDGVRGCVYGPTRSPDCAGPGISSSCDATGRFADFCFSGANLFEDCTSANLLRDPGAQCSFDNDGIARCAFGACTADTPPCDGNVMQSCFKGVLRRFNCPFGSTCLPSDSGGTCTTSGVACAVDRCDPKGAEVDCFKGLELQFPCSSRPIPGACVEEKTDMVNCVPSPYLVCDPMTHVDACDGTWLVYCDGEARALDCTALGFRGCSEASGQARCVE